MGQTQRRPELGLRDALEHSPLVATAAAGKPCAAAAKHLVEAEDQSLELIREVALRCSVQAVVSNQVCPEQPQVVMEEAVVLVPPWTMLLWRQRLESSLRTLSIPLLLPSVPAVERGLQAFAHASSWKAN